MTKKIFISYTHDSINHKEQVLSLSDRLCRDGIDSDIDQYQISPPEGWSRWSGKKINNSDYTLVVCTEIYKLRFEGNDEEGKGLGGKWEGSIITREIYSKESKNYKFIPITFSVRDIKFIPSILRDSTYYDLSTEEGYTKLYQHITGQSPIKKPQIGDIKELPSKVQTYVKAQIQDFTSIKESLEYIFQNMLGRYIDTKGLETYSDNSYIKNPVKLLLQEIMNMPEFNGMDEIKKKNGRMFYKKNENNNFPIEDLVIY